MSLYDFIWLILGFVCCFYIMVLLKKENIQEKIRKEGLWRPSEVNPKVDLPPDENEWPHPRRCGSLAGTGAAWTP